ncbi:hypothetical protein H7J89_24610 [Mycobacterium paraffinicum]|uniref:Secreted protein n=2 Tax=Mycobacterium paraffinicum TaxID=53378 RepID=A0ABP8RE92_9MYCO|nr:hypothetical protein [Mycobacterium paraffinicum]
MNVMSRIVAVPIAALTIAALALPGPAAADPPPTQQISVMAVGPDGQPMNGYRESTPAGNVVTVEGCEPSPSAMADNVYSCSPSAAGAGTCWPSTPGSLLCVNNPWTKTMHRVKYNGSLPPVQPTATPEPFALTLDDGTQCRLRNGGAGGGRADGYVAAYYCGDPYANISVLWLPSQGAGSCIDRSSATWTVKVGPLGTPDTVYPPPQTRAVMEAWFAGPKAGQ